MISRFKKSGLKKIRMSKRKCFGPTCRLKVTDKVHNDYNLKDGGLCFIYIPYMEGNNLHLKSRTLLITRAVYDSVFPS